MHTASPVLQSLLEVYGYLTPCVTIGTLLALWPLCRQCRDVQDQIVLLLKKAMFNKDSEARLVAVWGFLYLILQELRHPTDNGEDDGMGNSSQAWALPLTQWCSAKCNSSRRLVYHQTVKTQDTTGAQCLTTTMQAVEILCVIFVASVCQDT